MKRNDVSSAPTPGSAALWWSPLQERRRGQPWIIVNQPDVVRSCQPAPDRFEWIHRIENLRIHQGAAVVVVVPGEEQRRRADHPLLPGLLGFPLTELIENRDYPGSSHFFFDIGNGNLLAFFDFPGLDLGPYAEVLGGLHHMAISVEPGALGPSAHQPDRRGRGVQRRERRSLYFRDPDGARLELIADPLGERYGAKVL